MGKFALAIGVLLALVRSSIGQDKTVAPLQDKDAIRKLLRGHEPAQGQRLLELREKAFPAYEQILSDSTATAADAAPIFYFLRLVGGERGRFVDHAVRWLANSEANVHWQALKLLQEIGRKSEASPAVALLWEKDEVIVRAAADTLGAIGGDREIVALDIWIKSATRRQNDDLQRYIQKVRDDLHKKVQRERTNKS